ncbi:ribosome biogenesis GTP-binding protein YihA/YsxC [Fenollaria sporofastidiosus]|uniref:ribosome biogenesis GTP-binding protein YihA/YsxC n=1 Tax=Fenollaria sporofastidiosus TaxID=2811778 RepID=UPI001C0009F1|nr:ribosome biogenesis GTP-binding protein YihA/YsxC [Fenollaria sporofastidiosus]
MLKINEPFLERMAVDEKSYPNDGLKEIVLVGRSNVGKSSFINALTNRKKLAYTSSSPGKTRTINFYNMDNKFRIVDLPGYGYAKISMKEREKWKKIIEEYLVKSKNIALICQIIDVRHEPTKLDMMMYDYILSTGSNYLIIANKLDKLKSSQVLKQLSIINKVLHNLKKDALIPFSSQDKRGVKEVLAKFENII